MPRPAGQKGLLLHGAAHVPPQKTHSLTLSKCYKLLCSIPGHDAAGNSMAGAGKTFHDGACMQTTLHRDHGHPAEANTAPRLQTTAPCKTQTLPSTAGRPRQQLLTPLLPLRRRRSTQQVVTRQDGLVHTQVLDDEWTLAGTPSSTGEYQQLSVNTHSESDYKSL
jgi:hypothetical protein